MNDKNVQLENKGWCHFYLMEPPVFLSLLANGLTTNVLVDLIVFQTCRQVIGENTTSCDILHTNSSSEEARALQKIIQPYASNIIMCTSIMRSIFPAMLILFFGPWSDKYGRKPLILIGYFVSLCRYIIMFILTYFDANPWLILLSYLPTALLGSGLLLATTCYVSDTTEPDKRPWRLACLQTCVHVGLIIGTFSGAFIFQRLGYMYLFVIAASLSLFSLLYVFFIVPESIKKKPDKKWGNPLNLSFVKQLIFSCTKQRDGLNRGLLWNCLLIVSLYRIVTNGHTNVIYLFVNAKLGWNIVDYSMFNSLSMVISIVGTFSSLKLMKDYMGFSNITILLVGSLSGILASLCISITSKDWHMWLFACLGIFMGVILPTSRSLITESTPPNDSGKTFSLVTFLDTLLPLGSSPLYSLLYSSYIATYPSPVYLMTAGIFALIFFVGIFIYLKYSEEKSLDEPEI
ncbi:proton-coupled folate transporter-like [Cotesia glomerata]|nr:proton-coupled folate transporter-like [Cotesia glomerata]